MKCMNEVWKKMLSPILDVNSNDSLLQFSNVKERKALMPSTKRAPKQMLKNFTMLAKTDGFLLMNQFSLVSWLVDHGSKFGLLLLNMKISLVVPLSKLSMTSVGVILNVHTRPWSVWHVIRAFISLVIFTKQ